MEYRTNALARMQQHDRFAEHARACRGGQETLGIAKLLDDHGDHLRGWVVQQIVEDVGSVGA